LPGFEVSLPAVDELSARVAIAGSDIRGALGGLQLNVCLDTGNGELSAALDGFTQFWQTAVHDAADAVDSTATAMNQAAVQYGVIDSTAMMDPTITSAFVNAAISGDAGATELWLGPLLPGASVSGVTPPLLPGFSPFPGVPGG
jgi:hypothetical protein